jgi:hypothetical protein
VSDFITGEFTDDQLILIRDILASLPTGPPSHWPWVFLRRLHDAGIRVTFPDPRYYVDGNARLYVHVMERGGDGISVAAFNRQGHPDAQRAAEAECDRLNREVS